MRDQLIALFALLALLAAGSGGVTIASEHTDANIRQNGVLQTQTEASPTPTAIATPMMDDDEDRDDVTTQQDEVPEAAPQTGFGTL